MGIISPTIDPYNLKANYGPLGTNRTHLFNAAYSLDEGVLVHSNALVNGVANGWQLSGITQLESGANLTFAGTGGGGTTGINSNFGASYTCAITAAETAAGASCPQSAAIIPGSISLTNPQGNRDQ